MTCYNTIVLIVTGVGVRPLQAYDVDKSDPLIKSLSPLCPPGFQKKYRVVNVHHLEDYHIGR